MTDYGAFSEVSMEVTRAMNTYPKFNSPHEGWAVIKEEVDELWDLVKAWKANNHEPGYQDGHKAKMRAEAKQIAAMSIRFMADLT